MRTSLRLPHLALIAVLASGLSLGLLAAPAGALTVPQRVAYINSGDYIRDVGVIAKKAKRWVKRRSKKTAPVYKACKRAGYRVGRRDPGPDPRADYRIPVPVPRSQQPKRPIIQLPGAPATDAASNPGAGAGERAASSRRSKQSGHKKQEGRKGHGKRGKRRKGIHPSRARCARQPKLALAMDMDETMMSSFRVGSPQPNYDDTSKYRNELLGSQTALKPVLRLYRTAHRRGVALFVITARYEPLSADPLVGALTGGADLCSPALAGFGACGIDVNTFDFTKVTRENLLDVGYKDIQGLYMRPPDSESKGEVKNSQRAEITRRRHFEIIAMLGDSPSDLEGGFFERGYRIPSPE